MVVVKSLLAGGFTVSPKKKTTKNRTFLQTSSLEEDDSAVTSLEGDRASYYSTTGSTAPGDSFVLAIDWNDDDDTGAAFFDSFDDGDHDPYLETTEAIMKRLLGETMNKTPPPRQAQRQEETFAAPSPDFPVNTPVVFSPLRGSNMKSLGAFEWPDDEDNGETHPIFAITMPRTHNNGPTHISHIDDDADSFFVTALSIQPPVLPGPKHKPMAEETAQELREKIQTMKPSNLRVARLYLRLGGIELKLHEYVKSMQSFSEAASIFRRFSRNVALANALDKMAVTFCDALRHGEAEPLKNLYAVPFFSKCLVEALDIRRLELGPWHVDTVDTLQHLAHLCLALGHPQKAASHYLEVVNLRKAIFGTHHPSTAVTAHCLGNAYLQSHDTMAAEVWFEYSLHIYNELGIPQDNPAVVKLKKDYGRVSRVERWIQTGLDQDENLLFDI